MPKDPAVAILRPDIKFGLDRGHLMKSEPLARCEWPFGKPDNLSNGTIGDLGPDDHVVAMVQNLRLTGVGLGVAAKLSLILAEPAALHARRYPGVIRKAARFHRILSYNEDLLSKIPNGLFFPFGTTWIKDWHGRAFEKSKMCSLIASPKRSQTGHRLRHRIADWTRGNDLDVDLLGHAYAPLDVKADGLAPYRYSVVIENVRERNYFSEKLIDAIFCKTVPIYWGCPNIGDFIDTSGMIICESEDDIRTAMQTMSEADYRARVPALLKAQDQAEIYGDFYGRLGRAVLEDKPIP